MKVYLVNDLDDDGAVKAVFADEDAANDYRSQLEARISIGCYIVSERTLLYGQHLVESRTGFIR